MTGEQPEMRMFFTSDRPGVMLLPLPDVQIDREKHPKI